jgi:hypothetical protein
MSTIANDARQTVEVSSTSDITTTWDHVVMIRIRRRLKSHGVQLQLYADKNGWRWGIAGEPPTPQAFGSLHLALSHADSHTAIRFREPPLGPYIGD